MTTSIRTAQGEAQTITLTLPDIIRHNGILGVGAATEVGCAVSNLSAFDFDLFRGVGDRGVG